MALNNEAWKIATIMMDNNIPDEVYMRLKYVDELCNKAGGRLRSRQIIANIILEYKNGLQHGFKDADD